MMTIQLTHYCNKGKITILLGYFLLCSIMMTLHAQSGRQYQFLPDPAFENSKTLEVVLMERRSVRDYSDKQLNLQQVSQMLWAAYGITEERSKPGFLRGGLRTAPSAGALFPLEIYLIAGNVEGLKAGVYKYHSLEHKIELILEGDIRNELAEAALNQDFIEDAPISILYTAIYERTTTKYGERGRDRFVCMDLGHSAQNVYLQATALDLGTCAVGAFTDELVSNILYLEQDEVPLYIMPIGYPLK